MTNKQLVIELVQSLPDRTRLATIAERVAILAAVRRGERAAAAGRWISHEALMRQMKRWIRRTTHAAGDLPQQDSL